MKTLKIEIADIYGYSFGACMMSDEEVNENLEEGILEDRPFEITSSIVRGPSLFDSSNAEINIFVDDNYVYLGRVEDENYFISNREIDDFFANDQAKVIKEKGKSEVNEYYKSWRAGQSHSEDKLIEVFESGFGSMVAEIEVEDRFCYGGFFLIAATPLPDRDPVISGIGYLNSDGSVSFGSFEYEDYEWSDPEVHIDGERLYF